MSNETVKTAIAESISEHSIVHIESMQRDADTMEMMDALSAECDGDADYASLAEDDARVYEYWGTTEDGYEWRVHLTTSDQRKRRS